MLKQIQIYPQNNSFPSLIKFNSKYDKYHEVANN